MSIEERVERLERGNRFWKRIAFVLLAALGAVVLMGQAKSGEPADLTVRSLKVVDSEGQVRIRLGSVSKNRVASLEMLDPSGEVRADLRVAISGYACLRFFDQLEKSVRTPHGTKPVPTNLVLDGTPALWLMDRTGLRASLAPAQLPRRGMELCLVDSRANERVRIESGGWNKELETDSPRITVLDPKGDVIWQAPEKK